MTSVFRTLSRPQCGCDRTKVSWPMAMPMFLFTASVPEDNAMLRNDICFLWALIDKSHNVLNSTADEGVRVAGNGFDRTGALHETNKQKCAVVYCKCAYKRCDVAKRYRCPIPLCTATDPWISQSMVQPFLSVDPHVPRNRVRRDPSQRPHQRPVLLLVAVDRQFGKRVEYH